MPRHPKCPVTRSLFFELAKPIPVVINGVTYNTDVKEFSTGSFGWNLTRTVDFELGTGGLFVPVTVGLNLIVVRSKEALP